MLGKILLGVILLILAIACVACISVLIVKYKLSKDEDDFSAIIYMIITTFAFCILSASSFFEAGRKHIRTEIPPVVKYEIYEHIDKGVPKCDTTYIYEF